MKEPDARSRSLLRRVASGPWHVLMFAAFPVMALFSANLSETSFGEVWPSLRITLLVATAALFALRPLARSFHHAGIATSIGALLVLMFGHVEPALEAALPWNVGAAEWTLVTLGAVVYAVRTKHIKPGATQAATIVGMAIMIVPLATVVRAEIRDTRAGAQPLVSPIHAPDDTALADKRDIFFIVMDRYPARQTLHETYGLDNSTFYSSLEHRGFRILHRSISNYPKTIHSLASMLNLDYLDELVGPVTPPNNYRPLFGLLPSHVVGRFLKSQGYRYINIGPLWGGTALSEVADVNLRYSRRSDFGQLYWSLTLVGSVADRLGLDQPLDARVLERNSTLYQLRELEKAVAAPGPKFVLAHVLLPHPPYVLSRTAVRCQKPRRRRGLVKRISGTTCNTQTRA